MWGLFLFPWVDSIFCLLILIRYPPLPAFWIGLGTRVTCFIFTRRVRQSIQDLIHVLLLCFSLYLEEKQKEKRKNHVRQKTTMEVPLHSICISARNAGTAPFGLSDSQDSSDIGGVLARGGGCPRVLEPPCNRHDGQGVIPICNHHDVRVEPLEDRSVGRRAEQPVWVLEETLPISESCLSQGSKLELEGEPALGTSYEAGARVTVKAGARVEEAQVIPVEAIGEIEIMEEGEDLLARKSCIDIPHPSILKKKYGMAEDPITYCHGVSMFLWEDGQWKETNAALQTCGEGPDQDYAVPAVEVTEENDTESICSIDGLAARVLAHEKHCDSHGEDLQMNNGNFTFSHIHNEYQDPKLWPQGPKGTTECEGPNLHEDELLLKQIWKVEASPGYTRSPGIVTINCGKAFHIVP